MIYEIQKTRKEAPRPLEVSSMSDQGWREKDLENYLFEHLRELVSTDLMVISQSRPGEKADLARCIGIQKARCTGTRGAGRKHYEL
jgi:hypothetical protein